MTTATYADTDMAIIKFNTSAAEDHAVTTLTSEELDMIAGGFWPVVAFAVGAAIGYAIARYA